MKKRNGQAPDFRTKYGSATKTSVSTSRRNTLTTMVVSDAMPTRLTTAAIGSRLTSSRTAITRILSLSFFEANRLTDLPEQFPSREELFYYSQNLVRESNEDATLACPSVFTEDTEEICPYCGKRKRKNPYRNGDVCKCPIHETTYF